MEDSVYSVHLQSLIRDFIEPMTHSVFMQTAIAKTDTFVVVGWYRNNFGGFAVQ